MNDDWVAYLWTIGTVLFIIFGFFFMASFEDESQFVPRICDEWNEC